MATTDNLPYVKEKKRIRRRGKRDDMDDLKGTKSSKGSRLGRTRGGVGKTYSTSDFNKRSLKPKVLHGDDGSVQASNEDPEEIKRKEELEKFKRDILAGDKISKEKHAGDDLVKDLDLENNPPPVEEVPEPVVEE